tara:strand:- start:847 stop:999 length:153 start_codon:yes stop_codon:yes gene_type:complete
MKKLTYRGIAYQKQDKDQSKLIQVPGRSTHVYRGSVYHYELRNKDEKTSV